MHLLEMAKLGRLIAQVLEKIKACGIFIHCWWNFIGHKQFRKQFGSIA